jgi:hypothetical protein
MNVYRRQGLRHRRKRTIQINVDWLAFQTVPSPTQSPIATQPKTHTPTATQRKAHTPTATQRNAQTPTASQRKAQGCPDRGAAGIGTTLGQPTPKTYNPNGVEASNRSGNRMPTCTMPNGRSARRAVLTFCSIATSAHHGSQNRGARALAHPPGAITRHVIGVEGNILRWPAGPGSLR